MAESERPSAEKMWLILACVSPVGIPLTVGFAWRFAPSWIPFGVVFGATLFSPVVWLAVTVASSIYLGRNITEANDPRMKDNTATWIVTLSILAAHCVLSAFAAFLATGIARK